MTTPTHEEASQARARAIAQFREWAADPAVLIVDTETTGLDGRVWEFAAVRVQSPAPVLAFICDPGMYYQSWSAAAWDMHSERLVEFDTAPLSNYFESALGAVLNVKNIISYGAAFDHSAIDRTWPELGLEEFGCILTAYAPLAGRWSESKGDWKYVSLSEALELEGEDLMDFRDAHTAYGDALRAAALVRAVARRETDDERGEREWADHAEQMTTERGELLP
jgi:DNA polymerase III subunit epsilon